VDSKDDSEIRETLPLGDGKDDASQAALPRERRVSLLIYYRDVIQTVPLRAGEPIAIGREPTASVRIEERSLSREHARFLLTEGRVTVEDLGSTNGTKVAGRLIKPDEPCVVQPGDEVLLGNLRVFVHMAEGEFPGFVRHDRFRITLEDEVVRARHYSRAVSVLLIRAPTGHAASHVSRWAPRLLSRLRKVDRAALYSKEVVEILLSETDSDAAMALGKAIVTSHEKGEPPLFIGVASYPGAAADAESLCDLSWRAAQSATPTEPVKLAGPGAWQSVGGAEVASSGDRRVVVSDAMKTVFKSVSKVAGYPTTVLINGETGVGKEIVARAIHAASPRRNREMIPLNCGAIAADLIASTLFGYARGAFTGAIQDQKGYFEAADGGTLFLDEIGELSLQVQTTLLRVLDNKHVTRVGSTKEIPVDVRVIAATNRDLKAMVAEGTFRQDLWHRLSPFIIRIPPLRERAADIEPLAAHFLAEANKETGRNIKGFTLGALALLKNFPWPGNARELKNVVTRAVVLTESDRVTESDLGEIEREAGSRSELSEANDPAGAGGKKSSAKKAAAGRAAPIEPLKSSLQRFETEQILAALKAAGSQEKAAKLLGIPPRTFADRLKKLGIKRGGYDA